MLPSIRKRMTTGREESRGCGEAHVALSAGAGSIWAYAIEASVNHQACTGRMSG
jgi:hypothetical protein